ncbi:MAG: hypothetical protein JWN76_1525 [Chitinophagaceae bacterium]|nr:hypothetical protein [Chitinophagaceae bacterium]
MKKWVWVFCLLLPCLVQAQTWSKVNVGEKLMVYFPAKPLIEDTPLGPQAQCMDEDHNRFTAMLLDMRKSGMDPLTWQLQVKTGFTDYARQFARQGGVTVEEVTKSEWNNHPMVTVKGHNNQRRVLLQLISSGTDVILLGYSALPDRLNTEGQKKFFSSLFYPSVSDATAKD